MKYYSEKTKKYYNEDQLDLLKQDEKQYDDEIAKQEIIKAERADRAKEVEAAYKEVEIAQKKADELLAKFCKDYGSYHMTVKGVNPRAYQSLFDFMFNEFPFKPLI